MKEPTSTTEDALMRLDDDGGPQASPTPERQCGRCRLFFAGDVTLIHPGVVPEWWLCPACRAALLPAPPARRPRPLNPAVSGGRDVS
jgi:hypothetical protein